MIPFESQRNRSGERRCGAAALIMIYRNLGLTVDQDTVWQEIRHYLENSPKIAGLRTFHLARNALEHGLTAIPGRFRNPWESLKVCSNDEIRVILNHRIQPNSLVGHFSVFAGIAATEKSVQLHDPQYGPNRIVAKSELLELWQPKKIGNGIGSEITGNVAVLITAKSEDDETCPKCGGQFAMKPFRHLDFQTVFCPWCDAVLARQKRD